MTVPDVAEARAAGVVSRGTAAVLDLLTVGLLLGLLYAGLLLTRLALNPGSFRLPAVDAVFSTAVGFVVAVLYLGACWTVSGCTVGSVAMGLRVVGRRRERLRPVIALLRGAACVAFPIGLVWAAVDVRRRSVQDIVFGSRVIYVRS